MHFKLNLNETEKDFRGMIRHFSFNNAIRVALYWCSGYMIVGNFSFQWNYEGVSLFAYLIFCMYVPVSKCINSTGFFAISCGILTREMEASEIKILCTLYRFCSGDFAEAFIFPTSTMEEQLWNVSRSPHPQNGISPQFSTRLGLE